jgi:hypothetical protein
MTIIEILDEAKKDLHLNRDELIGESVRTPDLFSKYHKMYRVVRLVKKDLIKKLKELEKEKWEYYSGLASSDVYKNKPFGLKLQTKEARQKYVDADPDILDIRSKVETIEEKEDTIKTIMDQINNRSYQINNANKSMEYFHNNQA